MEDLQGMALSVLTTLVAAATPFLVAYLVAYLRKQLRKVGLEATDQELETVRKIATEAVHYAAQKAKVRAKDASGEKTTGEKTTGEKTTGEKMTTSHEKKDLAMAFAYKLAGKYGVSESAQDTMEEMLEAALGSRPEL